MEKLKKLWRFLTTPEMISYIVFGVLTTVVNIVSYGLLRPVIHWNSQWDVLTANTIAWILSVDFAFITNKLYVFQSISFAAGLLMRERAAFVGARLFSLAVDSLGMYLMVTALSWNDWIAKIIMNVIVVIINYVLSKWFIFKK
ncbi:MAG: GtrA family protein [Clostridiales bacterium]|nr:GtrA family protein [Clostridiales bacterium]